MSSSLELGFFFLSFVPHSMSPFTSPVPPLLMQSYSSVSMYLITPCIYICFHLMTEYRDRHNKMMMRFLFQSLIIPFVKPCSKMQNSLTVCRISAKGKVERFHTVRQQLHPFILLPQNRPDFFFFFDSLLIYSHT